MAIYDDAMKNILANNQQNPYLKQQGDFITQNVNNNLQRNILPGIGRGAQSAGQYGGSRQGIAEGLAAGEASGQIAGQLANMYGQDYSQGRALQGQVATQLSGQDAQASMQANQLANSMQIAQMNDKTQNRSLDNQYSLGMGNLGLQQQGQNNNFYSTNRGQDLQQYQLGASLYGQGNQGNLGIGQSQYGLGNQAQQNGYDSVNQYSGILKPYTGLNQSNVTSGGNQSQNNWGNALGAGALGLGLWNAYNGK